MMERLFPIMNLVVLSLNKAFLKIYTNLLNPDQSAAYNTIAPITTTPWGLSRKNS